MAGDWIKIEHVTPDKPEIHQIASILGIDPDAVVGKMLRFWIWADQQALNGNAISVTKIVIDRITYAPGFADALLKVDWLQARSGSLAIPHFDRHNGHTAKQRADTNRRVTDHRKRGNATSVTSVTHKPLQKPLPEKRREEVKNESDSAAALEAALAPKKHRAELARLIVDQYPRKERVAEAMQVVANDLAQGAKFDDIMAGTKACAAVITASSQGHNGRYVPGALNFFVGKRWQDDPSTICRKIEEKPDHRKAKAARECPEEEPHTPKIIL